MAAKNQSNIEKSESTSNEAKIKSHKQAARHLELAAKHQLSAAKHYQEGHPDKAVECSNESENEIRLAHNCQKEASKDQKGL